MDNSSPQGRTGRTILCFHLLLLPKKLARTHHHGLHRQHTHRMHHRFPRQDQSPQSIYRYVGGAEGI